VTVLVCNKFVEVGVARIVVPVDIVVPADIGMPDDIGVDIGGGDIGVEGDIEGDIVVDIVVDIEVDIDIGSDIGVVRGADCLLHCLLLLLFYQRYRVIFLSPHPVWPVLTYPKLNQNHHPSVFGAVCPLFKNMS
jgi:hypothetical protein